MLLAIDIGNTNVTFGILRGNAVIKRFCIATGDCGPKNLRAVLKGLDIGDTLICSVVPEAALVLSRQIKTLTGRRPRVIGGDIKVPIRNLYRAKSQVGQDRLVNAYAASVFYGTPAIVVDFGTAVTFDVISRQGAYMGGMILPGLQLSLDALGRHTALLPALKLASPAEFIGGDTKNSILSGVVNGMAAAVDELCARIKDEIGRGAGVVGTGGNISVIGGLCRQIRIMDKDLTLKGINLIFSKHALLFERGCNLSSRLRSKNKLRPSR